MLSFLKKNPEPARRRRPATIGDGHRVYAIGDIHGRADLFTELLGRIEKDDASRDPVTSQLILLGDLVDRGPQSRAVVEQAMQLKDSGVPVRFLKGNHEDVFLRAAAGDVTATKFFCRIGGRETILSYGLDRVDYDAMTPDQIAEWLVENIPRSHVDFLEAFEDMVEIGDFLFVHAGIRPGIPLTDQTVADLRWIRDDFLSSDMLFGKIIVHGHTITERVDERINRIGIDTGAYDSGRLTAIGLQGAKHWFLSTAD